MKLLTFSCLALVIFISCQKSKPNPRTPRVVTDTLMVYSQETTNGKSNILSKSFKTGETKTVITNGAYPFATNLRLVYIKSGTTLGFAKVDGVSRLLIPLTQPTSPSLSLDSRLICLIDKVPDKYQLLKYDTVGNKTTLFETTSEITTPSFSSDGQKIVFTQKDSNSSSLFFLPITGGTPSRITTATANSYDEYGTVLTETIYFVRSRLVGSILSSEIFSANFGGSTVTQLTNFTNNWTTPSFFIKNLRKVGGNIADTTSLIFSSNHDENINSDIYLYKVGGSLTKMTETGENESFPSLIPNFEKP